MTTWFHEERLSAVQSVLRETGAARLLDLGCGDGDLLLRLAVEPWPREIVGIDVCTASLDRLRQRLTGIDVCVPKIVLREASMTMPAPDLAGFDCAVLIETIEHLWPDSLSRLERALFHEMRPAQVVVTTPNAEFNSLLGVPSQRFRHPGHRFEWTRSEFRRWGARAAAAGGYNARFEDIAGAHPDLGGASQMAVFDRRAADAAA